MDNLCFNGPNYRQQRVLRIEIINNTQRTLNNKELYHFTLFNTQIIKRYFHLNIIAKNMFYIIFNKLDLHRSEPECVIYYDVNLKPTILQEQDIKEVETVKLSSQDKLEREKTHFIRIMGDSIGDKLSISNFALFNFFKLNHYLESKGYFITDENREEEYLKVINSGDTEVLEKLSEYLDSLDEFNAVDEAYKAFKDFKDRIDSAVDEEELRSVYNEFAKTF